MSHCKIVHLVLVLHIQKNFTLTSKTVYIYVFCFFVSQIKVKIDHVFMRGNYIETLLELG